MTIRVVCAALAIATLAGCVAQRERPGRTTGDSATSQSPLKSASTICRDTFTHHVVLGWDDAKVAELRAYQYGGPIAQRPLESAFPHVPANTPGAWCVVLQGPDSSSLWGAVPGSPPRRAITITGPGEDRYRGQMHGPPQVP